MTNRIRVVRELKQEHDGQRVTSQGWAIGLVTISQEIEVTKGGDGDKTNLPCGTYWRVLSYETRTKVRIVKRKPPRVVANSAEANKAARRRATNFLLRMSK